MTDIAVIILVKNEVLHIRRCLENVAKLAPKQVFVVDSPSTDEMPTIARSLGATVEAHDYPGNQAEQFNWALDNCPITAKWVLRLDADEYLSDALIAEIKEKLDALPDAVTGVAMPRDLVFLGKQLRFGFPKVVLLRLFRFGKGRCENRKMDEHIVLSEGECAFFEGHFADHNLNDLVWWTQKHLGYAKREMADLQEQAFDDGGLSDAAARKRRMKGAYARLPLFWRSFAYFLYRYVLRLGFLDGKRGFLWAFLQAWWYRTFVDALLYEDELRKDA